MQYVTESKTDYVYSQGGCHVVKITRGAGSAAEIVTEYGYDCNGNLSDVWDANHAPSDPAPMRYTYDALDRLTTVRQSWGGSQPPPDEPPRGRRGLDRMR